MEPKTVYVLFCDNYLFKIFWGGHNNVKKSKMVQADPAVWSLLLDAVYVYEIKLRSQGRVWVRRSHNKNTVASLWEAITYHGMVRPVAQPEFFVRGGL